MVLGFHALEARLTVGRSFRTNTDAFRRKYFSSKMVFDERLSNAVQRRKGEMMNLTEWRRRGTLKTAVNQVVNHFNSSGEVNSGERGFSWAKSSKVENVEISGRRLFFGIRPVHNCQENKAFL